MKRSKERLNIFCCLNKSCQVEETCSGLQFNSNSNYVQSQKKNTILYHSIKHQTIKCNHVKTYI